MTAATTIATIFHADRFFFGGAGGADPKPSYADGGVPKPWFAGGGYPGPPDDGG
jgi:hypothetical protein